MVLVAMQARLEDNVACNTLGSSALFLLLSALREAMHQIREAELKSAPGLKNNNLLSP